MKRMRRGGKDSQGIERVLKMSMLGWMLVLGTVCVPSGEARHLKQSECGPPPKFQRRIAHGLDALQGRYPYMASLQDEDFFGSGIEHFCGGVLVAPNYVLTAAHCIKEFSFPYVVIGADKLSVDVSALLNGDWQRFTTCRTIVHKDYNTEGERENDIALIQISRDSDIFPIALNKEKVDPGREVRALGFGRTETVRISDRLQQLDLEILSNQRCIERFEDCDNCTTPTIYNEMVCGQARKRADVCRGDSGGPIVLTPGGVPDDSPCDDVLVGVTSRGFKCDDVLRGLRYPGIFTRVSEYISWIENRGAKQSKIQVNPEIEDSCFERPEDTEDGRYPYVVSIQSDGSHICEGVLVAANVVLTAAQCVELEPFPFVKIGSRYLSDDDPRSIKEEVKFPVEEFSVCTTILHENHKEDPAHYDLALLVMSKDSKHTPITISTEGLNHTMEGRVVGWGAKNEKAYYSELRSLNREITKDGECGNRTTIEVVPPFQRALGTPLIQSQKGRSADDPTKDSLLGIGGESSGCSTGLFSYPRVFIHVADFASWIRNLGGGQNETYTRINPDINQCFRFEPTCSFLFKRWIGNNCKGKIGYKPHSP